MDEIQHKNVSVNGLQMHVAELGEGPLVLFLHGFPELWYSWRHQILFLAANGYRAVAPDLRGYGETSGGPIEDSSKFSTLHIVGDMIALLQAIAPDEDKVFIVGHDWGAYIAWHLCLFRPEKVKALVNLSVPYLARNPSISLLDALRERLWRRLLHVEVSGSSLSKQDINFRILESQKQRKAFAFVFQVPGEIEAEFAQTGTEQLIKQLLTCRTPGPWLFPKGEGFCYASETPAILPPWLTEEDLAYYVAKFEKTGFTGGLNYYRALNITWEATAAWTGARVNVPTKFVIGDLDLTYHMPGVQDYIHKGGFKIDVPLLEEATVIKDAAHFINQERPEEINKLIYDFIRKF